MSTIQRTAWRQGSGQGSTSAERAATGSPVTALGGGSASGGPGGRAAAAVAPRFRRPYGTHRRLPAAPGSPGPGPGPRAAAPTSFSRRTAGSIPGRTSAEVFDDYAAPARCSASSASARTALWPLPGRHASPRRTRPTILAGGPARSARSSRAAGPPSSRPVQANSCAYLRTVRPRHPPLGAHQ